MTLHEALAAELELELPVTRRAVEAAPEGKDDWKPHPKSMALGRLTDLVARMPSWLSMMMEQDEMDVAPAGGNQNSEWSKALQTRAERIKTLEAGFAAARTALLGTTDEHLMKTWTLKAKGQVVQQLPRYLMLQESINHLAHHRGQLTVYLRLNDIAVPTIYGPTADDQRFS